MRVTALESGRVIFLQFLGIILRTITDGKKLSIDEMILWHIVPTMSEL